ncbi:MAG: zinc-finger domain-containing protein, partial [Dehalococcoidia bacterium]
IGVSPPHDHPHVYINIGNHDAILCPYCATRYRYDARLAPFEADPQDSLYQRREILTRRGFPFGA